MRQLSLILLLCMAAILDHALALHRIKRNDAEKATNHSLIAQDFVKLQIEEPLEVGTKKETALSDNVSATATAANAVVGSSRASSTGSSRSGIPNAANHATSEQMNNYSCPKQTVDVTHFEPLDSANFPQSQYTPTNFNASAYAHAPTSSSDLNTTPDFQVKVLAPLPAPAFSTTLKNQLELSRLLKEKKLQTAQQQQQQQLEQQQQQEQQEEALSSSCSLKKATKPGISFMLEDHVPSKPRGNPFENQEHSTDFSNGDDGKLLLTRAGVSDAAGSSGKQLQPLLGERSHFKYFGGNLPNKERNIIDCNIGNYAANNYDSDNNNADSNNNKDNNVVANNVDKGNGNAGHNDDKNSNNDNNKNDGGNSSSNTKNNNNNNVDSKINRNNINNNKNNNNDNNQNNNLMNIFGDNVSHNLLQQPEQPQSAASLPAAPYATGTDNKINQFNKQSQQLQQLLYPQVGGSQQLWRPSNNKFAPMENVMKFANMLLYKVGLDSSPFHAQGAQLVLNPNLSPNFSPSPNGNSLTTIGIPSASLGASNPLDIDDFDTIDYLYNTLDTLPSMHPAGGAIATTGTAYARPLVFQPQYGANDPSQPFNFFESALDLLLGDEDGGEDELEMRCPLHHDKKSTAEGSPSGAADDAKNDLIQVCSCRLIKKKKNA